MYTLQSIDIVLAVPSIEETAAWYEHVLGWTAHYDVFDAEGRCLFGSVMQGDLERLMRGEETFKGFNLSRFQEGDRPYSNANGNFSALISVDDVDAVYAQVVAGGGEPGSAPENQFWGGRTFSLRDLNGFNLTFVQQVESVTLEEIRQRHQRTLGSQPPAQGADEEGGEHHQR